MTLLIVTKKKQKKKEATPHPQPLQNKRSLADLIYGGSFCKQCLLRISMGTTMNTGGIVSLTVVKMRNGVDNLSSNPGQGCLDFTLR